MMVLCFAGELITTPEAIGVTQSKLHKKGLRTEAQLVRTVTSESHEGAVKLKKNCTPTTCQFRTRLKKPWRTLWIITYRTISILACVLVRRRGKRIFILRMKP